MLNRLSAWIHARSTGRIALAALILFVLFMILVLPRQAARAESYSGGGSPDGAFYYTAEQLYEWADAFGAAGRDAYLRARWTFDVAWPLVYTFFLATALSWVLRRAVPVGSPWLRGNLVPVLGMTLDFLENTATSLVMARYPATTPLIANLAGVFTLLKWVFVNGSFVLLLLALVDAGWRWVKARRQRGAPP